MRSRDEVLREFGAWDSIHGCCPEEVHWSSAEAMADRIRELEAASGEPVAWALYDYDLTEVVNLTAIADVAQRWRLGYGYTRVVPLYPAPPSAAGVSDDAKDAARYRFLRERGLVLAQCFDANGNEVEPIRVAFAAADENTDASMQPAASEVQP